MVSLCQELNNTINHLDTGVNSYRSDMKVSLMPLWAAFYNIRYLFKNALIRFRFIIVLLVQTDRLRPSSMQPFIKVLLNQSP